MLRTIYWMVHRRPQLRPERETRWLRSSFSGKSIIRKRQSIFLAALPKSQARPIQFFVRP
jgi:hypothetical protein